MKSHWIQRDVIDHLNNFLSYSNDRTSQNTILEWVANPNCESAFIAAVATENWEELDGKIHMLHFEETEMTDSFPMFSMNGSQ